MSKHIQTLDKLDKHNDSTSGMVSMSRLAVLKRTGRTQEAVSFTGGVQEAVDLTSTADLIDRGVTLGYLNESYQGIQTIIGKKRDMSNFSDVTDYRLNAAKPIPVVPKFGQYTANDPTDEGFTLTLDKYGYLWELAWEDMLRDRADLGLLQDYPQSWGQAAAFTHAQVFTAGYAASATLFTGGQGNSVTTPLTAASLEAGLLWIRQTVTTPSGDIAPYRGRLYLVVPEALRYTASSLINSTLLIGRGDDVVPSPDRNPMAGAAELIVDPFLTSTTGWYLFCDPSIRPAIRWGMLSGNPPVEIFAKAPDVQSISGGSVDNQTGSYNSDNLGFKVRTTFGVNDLDYRGGYYSDGTS